MFDKNGDLMLHAERQHLLIAMFSNMSSFLTALNLFHLSEPETL